MSTFTEPISRVSWESASRRTEANRASLAGIKSLPATAVVTFWAVDWFNAVTQFRNEEASFLCQDGQFEATLDDHRAVVSQLIFQGETLVLAARKCEIVKDAGFSIDDIRATIESLRETFRGVHGPHNHPVTNERLLAILEAA